MKSKTASEQITNDPQPQSGQELVVAIGQTSWYLIYINTIVATFTILKSVSKLFVKNLLIVNCW